jgi:hypothetical protein
MTKDATDQRDNKLREACGYVERTYDDRWPARGKANTPGGDYRPLENVSREGRQAPYRKWRDAR